MKNSVNKLLKKKSKTKGAIFKNENSLVSSLAFELKTKEMTFIDDDNHGISC